MSAVFCLVKQFGKTAGWRGRRVLLAYKWVIPNRATCGFNIHWDRRFSRYRLLLLSENKLSFSSLVVQIAIFCKNKIHWKKKLFPPTLVVCKLVGAVNSYLTLGEFLKWQTLLRDWGYNCAVTCQIWITEIKQCQEWGHSLACGDTAEGSRSHYTESSVCVTARRTSTLQFPLHHNQRRTQIRGGENVTAQQKEEKWAQVDNMVGAKLLQLTLTEDN